MKVDARTSRYGWGFAIDNLQRMNTAVAKTDVDEPALLIEVNDEPEVVANRTPLGRFNLPHLARHVIDREADTPQEFAEAAVQLEAPSAAALLDNLWIRPFDIGAHPAVVIRVQVLEGHVHEVCKLQVREQRQARRADGLGDTNAPQIAIDRKHLITLGAA